MMLARRKMNNDNMQMRLERQECSDLHATELILINVYVILTVLIISYIVCFAFDYKVFPRPLDFNLFSS